MSGETANEPEQRLVATTHAIEMALDLIKNLELAQARPSSNWSLKRRPTMRWPSIILASSNTTSRVRRRRWRCLRRAAAADQDTRASKTNLGNIHVELGDIDAAIEAYRAAISLDPNLPDPYGNLAYIMRSRNEFAEAERLLRDTLRLNDQNGFAHHNLASLLFEHRTKEGSHCPFVEGCGSHS